MQRPLDSLFFEALTLGHNASHFAEVIESRAQIGPTHFVTCSIEMDLMQGILLRKLKLTV